MKRREWMRVRVDDRLERRPRLPARLRRAVERAGLALVAADEREDLARAHVDRDERALRPRFQAQRARAARPRPRSRAGTGPSRLTRTRAPDRRERARREPARVVALVVGRASRRRGPCRRARRTSPPRRPRRSPCPTRPGAARSSASPRTARARRAAAASGPCGRRSRAALSGVLQRRGACRTRPSAVADRLARGRLQLRVDRRRDREPADARDVRLDSIEHALAPSPPPRARARSTPRPRARARPAPASPPPTARRSRNPFSCICPSTYARRASASGHARPRAVVARVRDAPGDERGLGDGEVLRALAEVVARGLLDAVAPAPEVDVVEVELEDLVLAELLLEAPREERLADLARERPLAAVEEQVLHDLLRDRRAALPRARASAG